MENPFDLSGENLKILLDAYSAWCEKSEEGKYPKLERRKTKERKMCTLPNIAYTAKFVRPNFGYAETLHMLGTLYIMLCLFDRKEEFKWLKYTNQPNMKYLLVSG